MKVDVAVIGGGASGIVAAISARRRGASVMILEKMPRLGKKIRVSGNGRCNLSNDNLDESFFNPEAAGLIKAIFLQFGKIEILDFFKELGLLVTSDEGRIFPVTNQAASVMDVLETELEKLGVKLIFDFEVTSITGARGTFLIKAKAGSSVTAGAVVLCGGGQSYPLSGSDGGAYKLAISFGHSLIAPVPSTVPLLVKDAICQHLHGQRIAAKVTVLVDGQVKSTAQGELLFKKDSLSGTAILDVSEEVSIALNRLPAKKALLAVDLVPFMSEEELRNELSTRLKKRWAAEKLLMGILPNRFMLPFLELLQKGDPAEIAVTLKRKTFSVDGTLGWNEAEFTAGGIDTNEVGLKTLESKKVAGLFLAGEILNVQGRRGGYNLAWAWSSGFIAGTGAFVSANQRR